MQETRVWYLGREDPLEKEMATYSNILAWEILWTEEPGGLQSMGSQRVGHDWFGVRMLLPFPIWFRGLENALDILETCYSTLTPLCTPDGRKFIRAVYILVIGKKSVSLVDLLNIGSVVTMVLWEIHTAFACTQTSTHKRPPNPGTSVGNTYQQICWSGNQEKQITALSGT